MRVEESIREKLLKAFGASRLVVENESAKHAGHAPMQGHAGQSGETHFRVLIVSERFRGASRVERHRLVNDALKAELAGPVHALSIKALTPEEEARGNS
jgi:BolA protein